VCAVPELLCCVTLQGGWCSLQDVEGLKAALMRAGLLLRLNAPQQLVRAQEAALRARMAQQQQQRLAQ
jgi:hypothetical protein